MCGVSVGGPAKEEVEPEDARRLETRRQEQAVRSARIIYVLKQQVRVRMSVCVWAHVWVRVHMRLCLHACLCLPLCTDLPAYFRWYELNSPVSPGKGDSGGSGKALFAEDKAFKKSEGLICMPILP